MQTSASALPGACSHICSSVCRAGAIASRYEPDGVCDSRLPVRDAFGATA